MPEAIQGGMAMNIAASTAAPLGAPALRVTIVTDRPATGGPAQPVRVVSAGELASGAYVAQGNVPVPVIWAASDDVVQGGPALPVVIV